MWLISEYSWIMKSYSVSWLSLLSRCSISNNAEDLEWPRVYFTFSGSRKGNLSVYLPLSSFVVVRRKFSSQVTSDDFFTFTGSSSTSQSTLSWDVSNAWETLVEKAEISALEQALVLLGSIRIWFIDRGETHRYSAGYRLGVWMAVHRPR